MLMVEVVLRVMLPPAPEPSPVAVRVIPLGYVRAAALILIEPPPLLLPAAAVTFGATDEESKVTFPGVLTEIAPPVTFPPETVEPPVAERLKEPAFDPRDTFPDPAIKLMLPPSPVPAPFAFSVSFGVMVPMLPG